MAPSKNSEVLDKLSKEGRLEDLVELAKDFVLMRGGLLRTQNAPGTSDVASFVPFTLLPSPFPRNLYQQAVSVHQDFQTSIHRIALDRNFLHECTHHLVETDDFVRRLFELYDEVYTPSRKNQWPRIYLALTRNDYMLHQPRDSSSNSTTSLSLKQVEYNMTAVSFGPMSAVVGDWHSFLWKNCLKMSPEGHLSELNRPGEAISNSLVAAHSEYSKLFNAPDSIVLVVADNPARNVFDQRFIEIGVLQKGVQTLRRTFAQLRQKLTLDEQTGRLIVDGKFEVAVAYLRTGYNGGDYDFDAGDWQVRRIIELSRAIKTCCVAHQLANYKKVQQVLCQPGILEKFGLPADAAARMRLTFVDQYDSTDPAAVAKALADVDDFVLKPMKEGGGHNYFGTEMVDQLKNLEDSTESYVLMQLIRPPSFDNYAVSISGVQGRTKVSSELGIFGAYLIVDGVVLKNEVLGHLMRSKADGVKEVGVAAGFGRIDSPNFV